MLTAFKCGGGDAKYARGPLVEFGMRAIIVAAALAAIACSAPARPTESAVEPATIVLHDVPVELTDEPTNITIALRHTAPRLREVASDPKHALMLRLEGISIDRQPGVIYEVLLGNISVGALSFYGAEESNGNYVVALPIDEAATKVLTDDTSELRVTFTPRGSVDENGRPQRVTLEGHAKIARIRLVAE
jgi:hypothetical protein